MKQAPYIIIGVVIAVIVLYILFANPQEENAIPAPKPDHQLSYSGSIPYFGVSDAIASLKENYLKLNNVNLFWYQLEDNGTISKHEEVREDTEKDVLTFAKQNKITVSAGIDNDGNRRKVEPLLYDNDAGKNHIGEVLTLLSENGYDGLVVDYEGLEEEDAKDFTAYIKELSDALHARKKTLTVDVEIETSGRIFHGMDIVEIAKLADKVEISTYEEFGQDSGPGPIASIGWVNKIVKNIINQGVPAEKIIMGTSHSSHDWLQNYRNEFVKDETAKKGLSKLNRFNSPLKWDDESQSSFFEYEDEGNRHIVWLEEARSFKSKIDLAKAYQLQGVFIWYLGSEDPEIWNRI